VSDSPSERAKQYRGEATRLKIEAALLVDLGARADLLTVAQQFETLADIMESGDENDWPEPG
jgi:hypothetical protein